MKKILITGANSYIGTSFEKYVSKHYSDQLVTDTVDMIDGTWREMDFGTYDAVFHVAGIAHADIGNVDDETKAKYYAVNTDLAIETCKKSKTDGVKQFVLMSSMIIYGGQAHISKDTVPNPSNFYGDSKLKADIGVRELTDENFTVTVLRPPMIYGKGSKGNYPLLAKLARKLPVFPEYMNKRSMLYIENLCEFLCDVIMKRKGGIYWPQNAEYSSTSMIVKEIAKADGRHIKILKILNPAVRVAKKFPIKRIKNLANKAFGDSWYDMDMSKYDDLDYQKVSLSDSIIRTERK